MDKRGVTSSRMTQDSSDSSISSEITAEEA